MVQSFGSFWLFSQFLLKIDDFGGFGKNYSRFIFDGKNELNESEALEELEKDNIFVNEWYSCYKEEDIDNLLSKIRTVNYGQHLELRGGLKIIARPSGYHLGSATYSLQYGNENLMVIDSFSAHNYKHCLPLDTSELHMHNKIFVTDCFNQDPSCIPKDEKERKLVTSEMSINRFVSHLRNVLVEHKNENIILPVRNSMFLLDLLDIFQYKLPRMRKIHIISSVFLSSINFANANVDYLHKKLQYKIFAKTPNLPFNIEKMVQNNKIEFFDDMYVFVNKIKNKKSYISDAAPSIFIVVDSTLRLGYSAKIIEIISNEMTSGTVLFTDPYLKTSEIFFPLYSSNRLRISTQPLNLNDSCETLLDIVSKTANNSHIIAPKKYESIFYGYKLKNKVTFLADNSSVSFPLSSKEGLYIKPQVYNGLKWSSLETLLGKKIQGNDVLIGVIESGLKNDRGKLRLEVDPKIEVEKAAMLAIDKNEELNEKNLLDKMYTLALQLQEHNFQILNVERAMDQDSVYVLKLMGNASVSVIKHSPYQTQIFTDNDYEYETILKCVRDVLGVYQL